MSEADQTNASMRLAAHLLTQDESPSSYVCVLDGGFVGTLDAGGYDTHSDNCATQARNITHALEGLSAVINAPGENDPTKLNLDDTLVIINTEFGRTPHGEGVGGRGHWPHAFPVLFIGGPVQERAVFGTSTPDSRAVAGESMSPTEHRIAALLALGIWPFEQDSFNVSDVPTGVTENQAVDEVLKRAFGA